LKDASSADVTQVAIGVGFARTILADDIRVRERVGAQ
jgi:hypothetical protein